MITRSFLPLILAATLPLVAGAAHAQTASSTAASAAHPFVSPMFTDNMVLQRGVADPVWGWTTPGGKVTVRVAAQVVTATAGKDGRWEAKVGPFDAGGPYMMTVAGAASQAATFRNILVGDVWVCSGQSNMEFGVGNVVDGPATMAAANNPNIRLFTVTRVIAGEPQTTLTGNWDVCTPETIKKGYWNGFSAVGYFFGMNLYNKLKVPIGLIHTSWGGTPAEAWTSTDGLKTVADYAPVVAQMEKDKVDRLASGYTIARAVSDWYVKNDRGTAASPNWGSPKYDATAWQTLAAPGYWEMAGIPALANFDGIVWLRKEVDLPADVAAKDLTLHFAADDNDTAWVNGVKVGATDGWLMGRSYMVPSNILKSGKNVIAIRVLDTGGGGGLYGNADSLKIDVPGGESISLVGPWQYQIGAELSKTAPYPSDNRSNPNAPGVLYNGMIAPVVPYGIKGAIWYQGESNAGRAYQYRDLLPAMIGDWRKQWGEGDFPFYIVQLANFTAPAPTPGDSDWAELREAQSMTAAKIKNSGIAVAIDIGDAGDIHPKNKQDVGYRLALDALANTYGEKVEYSGPLYKSMKAEGGAIRVRFTHLAGGLVAKNGKLSDFAIAGDDHKWYAADAAIDGETVLVSSPQVAHPVAVRYAWATNPAGCNLYNDAGLPASPFRTDDWPGVTMGKK